MRKIIKLFLLIFVFSIYSCTDPYENATFQVYDINPVSSYLETRPNDFSEWIKVLKYADLFNAVNQATESFTVFAPNNEAVSSFYKKKGMKSIDDLGYDYARELVKYHIIPDSIGLDQFIIGGKIENKTLSDDYLTVSFDETGEGGYNSIFINKEARVVELATQVSNGYIYVLNAVLSPLVETVYERVSSDDSFKIFLSALDKTSWSDSLKTIYDQIKRPDGTSYQQKRDYTVLAVSDEVYNKKGINSIDDLIRTLESEDDDREDPLFDYIAYHTIKGNYPLFDFFNFSGSGKKKLWQTMTDAVLEISQEEDDKFYINYASEDYMAQFIENKSDVPARNGVLHQVNQYLPIWQPVNPVEVVFDFCDYPEVASYIKTNGTTGQIYQSEHASSEYRTEITNLSCYNVEVLNQPATPLSTYNYVDYFTVKASSNWTKCLNKDQLILNLGYLGSIQMKTPLIVKGKYKVTLHFCYATSMNFMRTMTSGSNGGGLRFSFDGENVKDASPYATVPVNTLNTYEMVLYEEIEFNKTSNHDFKIVITDPSAGTNKSFRIQLDYLLFEPIID